MTTISDALKHTLPRAGCVFLDVSTANVFRVVDAPHLAAHIAFDTFPESDTIHTCALKQVASNFATGSWRYLTLQELVQVWTTYVSLHDIGSLWESITDDTWSCHANSISVPIHNSIGVVPHPLGGPPSKFITPPGHARFTRTQIVFERQGEAPVPVWFYFLSNYAGHIFSLSNFLAFVENAYPVGFPR